MIKSVQITQKVIKARVTSGERKTIVSVKSKNRVSAVLFGIRGLRGEAAEAIVTKIAAINLGGHRVVFCSSAEEVDYADNENFAHKDLILGITTQAADEGDEIQIRTSGELTENGWNWQTGNLIYCGASGLLTQMPPQTGFLMVIGTAISPTTIFINLRQPITLTE
jgi:hypothetical protein